MNRIDPAIQQDIEQIHASSTRLVFEFAGAGSLALWWLHSVPGSSRTILEATDRYSPGSLADLIGTMPSKFVAQATAEAMARAAYRRAMRLSDGTTPCIGVSCTATIMTDRVKRGEHGCWVAVQDHQGTHSYGLVLTKGARDRQGEEIAVSRLVLQAIGAAYGLELLTQVGLLASEQIETITTPDPDPLALLLAGGARSVTVLPDGRRRADAPVHGALLSGSFNPLHAGHERLAEAAGAALGMPVIFELPVVNADKPPLSYAEIERRVAQFRWRYPVILSRASLFVEKAAIFPSCIFVVGYDTAARLVEPRYYGGMPQRDTALATIHANGCRFLVAGRIQEGTFHTLADIAIPRGFEDLFVPLPESAFRVDLSSTQIRRQLAADDD